MRLLLTLTLLFGCVPVSHVIIGDTRESIQPSDVKIYIDYPAKYEKIALIDAGSNFAFKDPEILFTWQGKMDKVIERLKIEAAKYRNFFQNSCQVRKYILNEKFRSRILTH